MGVGAAADDTFAPKCRQAGEMKLLTFFYVQWPCSYEKNPKVFFYNQKSRKRFIEGQWNRYKK